MWGAGSIVQIYAILAPPLSLQSRRRLRILYQSVSGARIVMDCDKTGSILTKFCDNRGLYSEQPKQSCAGAVTMKLHTPIALAGAAPAASAAVKTRFY
jgi:hypothetical protein